LNSGSDISFLWSYGLEFQRELWAFSRIGSHEAGFFQTGVNQVTLCKLKLQGMWLKNKPSSNGDLTATTSRYEYEPRSIIARLSILLLWQYANQYAPVSLLPSVYWLINQWSRYTPWSHSSIHCLP